MLGSLVKRNVHACSDLPRRLQKGAERHELVFCFLNNLSELRILTVFYLGKKTITDGSLLYL